MEDNLFEVMEPMNNDILEQATGTGMSSGTKTALTLVGGAVLGFALKCGIDFFRTYRAGKRALAEEGVATEE